MSGLDFPNGFLWGSASASFQIEGAASADGREPSIWDEFCRVPGAIDGGHDAVVAVDHYHRVEQDVELMAELGLGAYRFSVSMPRVMPGGRVNPAGLDFYSRLVDTLLGHGITPWVTLYHWDLPASLRGGWTQRDTAQRFADYALVVHDRLGDRVRIWTTLNEPWCSAFAGYASGEHAPGRTDPVEALSAVHHLLLGHGLAVSALRAADPRATLGITLNFTPVEPADPASPADVDAARRVDGTSHRLFLEPVLRGGYPADVLADLGPIWPSGLVRDGDLATIATPIDVLGVNYYTTSAVRSVPGMPPMIIRGRLRGSPHPSAPDAVNVSRGRPATAMGWEIDPDGLYRLLVGLQRDWTGPAGIPIVITENGAAMDDEPDEAGLVHDRDRIAYLHRHIAAAHRAIADGVDLRGYFLWTLLDNFEWSHGYDKRFGIVRVDGDLHRVPKASARWYAEVARTGRVAT